MGNHSSTLVNMRKLHKGTPSGGTAAADKIKRKNRHSDHDVEIAAAVAETTINAKNGGQNGQQQQQQQQRQKQQQQKKQSETKYPAGLCDNLLSKEQIRDIQASWPHLEGELQAVLTEAFLALFTEHPDIKEKFFEFRNYTIEDLRRDNNSQAKGSALLQRHVPRVARALSKVVANLETLDRVVEYLQVLGKIHNQYGIKSHEIALLGPFFVSCSLSRLPSRERRVQESWLQFFHALNTLLRRGYPEVELSLSPSDQALLRSSFKLAKEAMAASGGEAAVIKLAQTYSTSRLHLQLRGCRDEAEEAMLAEAMDNHGMLLLKVPEEVVKDLDDKDRLDEYLTLLGRFHERCSVRKEHLDVMGPLFCQTIGPILQAEGRWDAEVRDTWLRLFRIIAFRMKEGYFVKQSSASPPLQQHRTHRLKSVSACNTPRIHLSPETGCNSGNWLTVNERSPGGGRQHLYQKNQKGQRRISVDDLTTRVRLQSQHCHAFGHQLNKNRRGWASSAGVNDIHDYQLQPNRGSQSHLSVFAGCEGRRWSSYNSGCLALGGSSAALIMKASAAAAAAEAKAKAKRRSSLHQLFGIGGGGNSKQEMRPRSRSAPIEEHYIRKETDL